MILLCSNWIAKSSTMVTQCISIHILYDLYSI